MTTAATDPITTEIIQIPRAIHAVQYLALIVPRKDGRYTWSVTGGGCTHKDTADTEDEARRSVDIYFHLKEKGAPREE